MLIFVCCCLLLTLAYAVLMVAYSRGWSLQKNFVFPDNYIPVTSITVIIPARNEAANISDCVNSVLRQNYPAHLLEVIVVDDHSTDTTAAIVAGFPGERVRCIDLSEYVNKDERITAYKKKAIATGIQHSKGELIVTTDADCTATVNWLRNIAAIYEAQNPVMIVAPVIFTTNGTSVANFQLIDFMSMQGITAAAHRLSMGNMSNGANLAYTRAAYETVDGFAGVDHLASGDDYLLMMKLQKTFPGRTAYLKSKEAIVSTPPQANWAGFLQQRIRWASKSGKYDDKKMTGILMLVYLFNVSFLIVLVSAMYAPILAWLLVVMLASKIAVELFFLMPVARFFGQSSKLYLHPLLQPLHITYIILAGFLGFLGGYQWKGRNVK